MRRDTPPGPRLDVVGLDESGAVVVRQRLSHGADPARALAGAGWRATRARAVDSDTTNGHVLTLRFCVQPCPAVVYADDSEVVTAPDVEIRPGERPATHQRVAAYAVITGPDGLLVTQFSDQTGAAGLWGLPGGGIELGEAPETAVLREVWEETGQSVELGDLLRVESSRWIGRAPGGRLEDFHAVRIIYAARCRQPGVLVVHDVGGTTAAALWSGGDALEELALTPGWREALVDLGVIGRHGDLSVPGA